MTIIGFETSTAVCSVGLFRSGQPVLEESIKESHIHSEKLLTLTQRVLQSGGVTVNQLDAVAISIGPGSFTGLRIGLSAAKGLCYALNIPMVAVSTLAAIAEAVRHAVPGLETIAVLLDARKEEWYAGEFRVTGENLSEVKPVAVRTLVDVGVDLAASSLIVTDKPDEVRRLLGAGAKIEDVHAYCRGGVVASIGADKAEAGEYVDAASLEPVYLKDFVVRAQGAVSS